MSRHSVIVASMLLVVFGGFVTVAQLLDYNGKRFGEASFDGAFLKGNSLAHISGIVERTKAINTARGAACDLELILPANARVFMTGMTGTTNGSRLG